MSRIHGLASSAVLAVLLTTACREREATPMASSEMPKKSESTQESGKVQEPPGATEIATFGAGCFWCVEAVLDQIPGVIKVTSGFMGGHVPNPTYKDVCTGLTGHAEVVQVAFDPKKISYEELLEYFWKLHDPTTLDRQGEDVGPQYRSAIFYQSDAQREAAEKSKKAKEASGVFKAPIVTEIVKAGPFYKAEDYHQDYYRLNKNQPYCRFVIAPKLEKLGLEK